MEMQRTGLSPEQAGEVAAAYGVGRPTGEMRPAARGELGRIWRLPAARGDLAVKELFHPPTEAEAAADVAFQLLASEHGVLLPEPRVRPDGGVLTMLERGPTVRAYAWMDLTPTDERPVELVAGALATLHKVAPHMAERRPRGWFADPVGASAWHALADEADAHAAPFASDLRRALRGLVELEALLTVGERADIRRCHLDLDDSNLRGTTAAASS